MSATHPSASAFLQHAINASPRYYGVLYAVLSNSSRLQLLHLSTSFGCAAELTVPNASGRLRYAKENLACTDLSCSRSQQLCLLYKTTHLLVAGLFNTDEGIHTTRKFLCHLLKMCSKLGSDAARAANCEILTS